MHEGVPDNSGILQPFFQARTSAKPTPHLRKQGNDMESIADRIRDVRRKQGRSALDVSLAAGVSKNTVWELERDPSRSPSVANLRAIAKALGVSEVWLMNGERSNSERAGFHESDAAPWTPPPAKGTRPDQAVDTRVLFKMLAPTARSPATFKLAHSLPDFALMSNDILIVDMNSRAEDGDLVLATATDMQNATQTSIVRRLFKPYLISARLDEANPVLLADGSVVQIRGKVCASFRSPDVR